MLPDLMKEIGPVLRRRSSRVLLISMAVGVTLESVQEMVGFPCPTIRIMPNTPVSISEGIILYNQSDRVTSEEIDIFLQAFSGAGRVLSVPEHLIDASATISGCGPAFADLFLEALADGGVACGVPRRMAMELAAQMLLGAAKLALESQQHPGALKDAVCSPAGTTIQGVRTLEKAGFRSAVMEAVIASYQKTLQL